MVGSDNTNKDSDEEILKSDEDRNNYNPPIEVKILQITWRLKMKWGLSILRNTGWLKIKKLWRLNRVRWKTMAMKEPLAGIKNKNTEKHWSYGSTTNSEDEIDDGIGEEY